VGTHDHALPPGADLTALTRYLHRAHDQFVESGIADPAIRPVVRDSWLRSLGDGWNPESSLAPVRLDDAALAEIRAAHPLSTAMPVIRRLLVDSATEAGLLVAVSDAAGQLLWVEGAHDLRSRAEGMNFVSGADWSEASAGTNAPGTALALGRPIQILGAEHLSRPVTPWSCSAAPIRDPDTGAVLGVLDLTGGPEVASVQSLSLVRATVAAVEAELRLARVQPFSGVAVTGWSSPRLDVLGVHTAVFRSQQATTRLSLRHSELLLLIALADDGLTAGELGVALNEADHASVTVRAELSRLRTALAPVTLSSRPYRLDQPIQTDIRDVRDHIRAGQLRAAVAAYRGPVLPASTAPAIATLRNDLHLDLRSALLASTDADALLSFADTDYGRDDFDVWRRALHVLPASSPRFEQVAAHAEELEAELG
jgi:transcriptional regulator of acetoin/glycerol metabolism